MKLFGPLYERYFEKVYSYLSFKAGNATEAEDLAGQVFLKAIFRDLPKKRPVNGPDSSTPGHSALRKRSSFISALIDESS